MSNSKKILVVVSGICLVSLLATLNLIRKDEAKRASENVPGSPQSDAVAQAVGPGSAPTSARTSDGSAPSQAGGLGDTTDNSATNPAGSVTSESQRGNQRAVPSEASQLSAPSTQVGVVSETAPSSASPSGVTTAPVNDTAVKKIKFPGIEQGQGRVMVRDVRHKAGEGDDQIAVTLTVTDESGEVAGRVWVIGEYVQRGTTGVMYMPSHDELNLSADGKPQNPNSGQTFSMRFNTEKKFVIKRPGFEGEELIAIRVGVWDRNESKLHVARVAVKNSAKKSEQKRAKVDVQ